MNQQNQNKTPKRIIFSAQADLKINRAPAGDAEPKVTLIGRPILWNVLSSDRGGYVVRLLPGSAQWANEVFALYHHEFRDVIGTTSNGTLRISTDDIGVLVEIDLPDTSVGRDVAELVEDRYVRGMSFSMVAGPEESEPVKEGDQQILNVARFTVDEVTVTPIPAFTQTSVDVKQPVDDGEEQESLTLAKDFEERRQKYEQYRHWFYGQSIR